MQITLPTPSDFSFRETLQAHGWRRLAPFECDDGGPTLSRVERLADGRVVCLTLTEVERSISIDVEGAECKTGAADEIRRQVALMLQLDIPVSRFHAYCRGIPRLAHIPDRRQGRLLRSPTVWEDCCKVILTTNTTWTQTVGMTKRLVAAYGSPFHGTEVDGLRAFPEPEQIASIPLATFAETARFGYRNQSVHALAVAIASGDLDLELLLDSQLPPSDVWRRLNALHGVGPYAASCLMIYLGRYSRVNVDSWARMMVGKELGRAVSDKEVHDYFAPYGEWSGLVYHFYPWREQEPVY